MADISSAPNQTSTPDETGRETVSRALASFELGRKLRQLRLKHKIGLVDLGRHTGLSASLLSQLENGKLIPTLPTLARIAMVFDVGVDYFFVGRKPGALFSVVRAAERMRFPDRSGAKEPNYFFECLAYSSHEKSLQAYRAEIQPLAADRIPEHAHDGAEFLHVLDGQLAVRYLDEETWLDAGDSVYFDSSQPHGYRALGEAPSCVLVITAPPRV